MADNVVSNPGAGGATFATDEIAGVQYPRTKVSWGSDGIATDTSAANPLPVSQTGPIPAGGNLIGHVVVDANAAVIGHVITDTGSTTAVTQPTGTNLHTVVDSITAALPAGANVIGHVIVDSGGGGGTQYTEDAVAVGDPIGTTPILVRKDTPSATVSNDGDNIAQRGSNFGSAYVTLLDGAGSIISSVGGGTQYTEDISAAADPVGTVPILVRKDIPAITVTTDGDNIAQRGTNYGAAYVQVVSSTGNYVDTFGGGTQYTEDAVAAADPVGNAFLVVRNDARSGAITSTDGDNIALRGTNFGELYVKQTDAISLTGALPAGANVIGHVIVDSGGGAPLYTEDAVATADPIGNIPILVRKDVPAATVTTDGDNIAQRGSNFGAAYVTLLDATGNILSAVGGGIQYAEDVASVGAENLTLAGAVRRDTPVSSSGLTGDYSTINTDANGKLWVNPAGTDATSYLPVRLTDGASFVAKSTEYTDGDVDASITGVAVMWQDAANTLRSASATKPLPVNVITGSTAGTQYTEDAVAAGDPVGTSVILVRKDTPTTTVTTDGDNIAQRGSNYGAAYVTLVDSSGNFLSTSGGVQYTEDAAAAADPIGNAFVVVRNDARTGSLVTTDGDNIALRGTNNGEVYVKHVDAIPVTTIIPGTAATNLGKAEDTSHSSGDVGVMLLGVRQTTATDLSAGNTDGDYEPLQVNATGKLWVDASGPTLTVGSHNVTNAGTFAVQATIAAGATTIGKAEDVASVDADVGVPAMAIRKATPANTSTTDGDYEMLQMSAGRLWVDPTGITSAAAYLPVRVTDGASFVAPGTEYSEGDTDASISGVAIMWEDAADTLRSVSAAKPLPVSIISGIGSTQYTEDIAATADPIGNALIVVRNDARSGSLTTTDGDNIALRGTNTGELYVKQTDAIPVTTLIPGTAATNLGKAEDVAHSSGDVGVMALAVRSNAAASTSNADGDYQPLITNTTGHLWVDASGQTLTVNSHAVTQATGTNLHTVVDSGTVTTVSTVTNLAQQGGVAISLNTGVRDAGTQRITIATNDSLAVTNAGTFATQATISTGKTLKTVSGTLAADTDVIAAVSTKRLKVQSYSLITTDNTGVLAIFKSNGTAGTELWRVYLKGPDANTPFGANLSTTCPAFIFATVAGEKLTLDVNSAATIHYSISYWDDDIT